MSTWLANLSVGKKLWLCMGTAIFFVIGFCAVAQYALSSTTAGFSAMIDDEFAVIAHGNSAKIAFLECRRNEKDVLYNDDESLVKRILDFSSKMIEQAKAADVIAVRIGDPDLSKTSAALVKSGEEYQKLFKLAVAAQVGQARMAATIPMRKAAAEAERQLNLMLDEGGRRILMVREQAQQRTATIQIVVLAFGLLVVVLGFASTLLLRSVIAKPLAELRDRMIELARGDHDSGVPFMARRDEVGKMADAVEIFRTSLIEAEQLRSRQRAEQESQIERAGRIQASVRNFENVV